MATRTEKKRKMSSNSNPNEVKSMKLSVSLSPLENDRNWLELPHDVTLRFFIKLDKLDILENAQFVCKSWYDLCKEPSLWRTFHINNNDEPNLIVKQEKMTLSAVDRSAGGLVDFGIEGVGADEILSYVASRASQLKRLRLACCGYICEEVFIEALKKLSSLEELEVTLCTIYDVEAVLTSCPRLKTFKFNNQNLVDSDKACNEAALTIARSMPELCHLQLIGNNMTTVGLTAILDGCPHLQTLDLCACFQLDLEGDLEKRLSEQIKDVKRVWDSTDEYEYQFRLYIYSDYWDEFDPTDSDCDNTEYVIDTDYYSL